MAENLLRKQAVILIALILCLLALSCTWIFSIVHVTLDQRQVFLGGGESMIPTIKRGDLILVEHMSNLSQIVAGKEIGDIIAFQKPGNPHEIVIHRAIDKFLKDGIWYFSTQGDNNPSPDYWLIPESSIVGKVIEVNSLPLMISHATIPGLLIFFTLFGLIVYFSLKCWPRLT